MSLAVGASFVVLFMVADGGDHAALISGLRGEGLRTLGAMELLGRLTAGGPRLTGSAEAEAAVRVGMALMVELGLEGVHLEPVEVPRWVRGEAEEACIVGGERLAVCALGGSVATPPEGITAPVVEVLSLDEADALGEAARGKIIFFNRPMDPTLLDTFAAYGGAADQRVRGASRAARHGAVAVLVRSLTMRDDDAPHTGIMHYDAEVPAIPAAALGIRSAEMLSRTLKAGGEVKVFLKMSCRQLDPVISHNVVGDWKGSSRPDEIILLGGHLDSWDLGVGAHDDGAGCAQSLQAVRLLRTVAGRLPRTVRVVLFMDEESGGTGGKAYAVAPQRVGEKHLAAIESDRGGFLPIGFTVRAEGEQLAWFQGLSPRLQPAGIARIQAGYGGVDINPLADQGTITIGLLPDSQRYFDAQHSANDVLEAVHPRELELGAVAMAALTALLAYELPSPAADR